MALPKLLTIKEVMESLGITSRATMLAKLKSGDFGDYIKDENGIVRIYEQGVLKYLARRTQKVS